MPDRTVKRRLQDAGDAALASDDGPIFTTVAKLVEALERSIPEGTQNAERKKEDLRLGRELNEVTDQQLPWVYVITSGDHTTRRRYLKTRYKRRP